MFSLQKNNAVTIDKKEVKNVLLVIQRYRYKTDKT